MQIRWGSYLFAHLKMKECNKNSAPLLRYRVFFCTPFFSLQMKLALTRDQTQVKFYFQNNVITNQRNKLCAKYISVLWSTSEGFPTAVFAAGEGQVLALHQLAC